MPSPGLALALAATTAALLSGCAPFSGPGPLPGPGPTPSAIRISDDQALSIGRRIWQNECDGTLDGLTSWNGGENFASLGIGHFIWYPPGPRGPFTESFPPLVAYLRSRGVPVQPWMTGPCPWPTREAFQRDLNGPQLTQLRRLLAATVPEQARFAALRLEASLPRLLAAAPPQQRDTLRLRFQRVASTPQGIYALVDYVNFKGEGVSPTETYNGQGWGLLQVLQNLQPPEDHRAFAESAARTLSARVQNSPPARGESRWLPGWLNRTRTYF